MSVRTDIGLGLAAVSTTLTNLAYQREHDAAASLPRLSLRHPVISVSLLLRDRRWMKGFAMEGGGFLLYAAALTLASLALVQSVAAGGIGVLAFVSARVTGCRLGPRRLCAVALSVIGLTALGVSLSNSTGEGTNGSASAIVAWIGGTVVLALVTLAVGHRSARLAIAQGLAGGMFFSIGDFSTKIATQGGGRLALVAMLIIGYSLGTSLLQLGYQRGGALTVAGLATLLTNALPIAAGTVVLHEPVPSGALGALRILSFCAVTAGAILLAIPAADAAHPDEEQVPGRARGRPNGGRSAVLPGLRGTRS